MHVRKLAWEIRKLRRVELRHAFCIVLMRKRRVFERNTRLCYHLLLPSGPNSLIAQSMQQRAAL